jgi:predicted DCC family thiol-disulfide oxidoreductase YuxK
MTTVEPTLPVFVFDGDCGFCRKWAAWVERRLDGSVTFVPFQSIDLGALGLRAEQVQTASYFVDEGRRTYRGNRSFSRALGRSRGLWRMLGLVAELPVVRTLLAPVYRSIARNRHRLPAPE